MTETTNDEETFIIELMGDGEEPEKGTPWILYLILAGVAAALLG